MTLASQNAESGGELECSPHPRTATDENSARVEAVRYDGVLPAQLECAGQCRDATVDR